MHTAPDAAVLEFLPSGSADIDSCRILITSLQSWAMPLIRYDVGDYGRPQAGSCACGLPFPLMAVDLGKAHHILHLPGGRRVHSGRLYKPLYGVTALRTFQIQHRQLDHLAIVAVALPGRDGEAETALGRVAADLRGELGPGVTVSVDLVDRIPRTGRGKQPIVVSQVPQDTSWHGLAPPCTASNGEAA
jgi:phenylacetate-CoA ligase